MFRMNKVLFILHQKTSVPGDIGNKFINRGYNIEICRPPLGDELPKNLTTYSTIVVFGAPGSINDDDEFIKKEIHWLKNVIDSDVPFLGICFGAQLLAKYLGSEVKANSNGISEIGFYKIKPTAIGEQLFKSQTTFYQFHSEGFDLPTDCELLARGDIFNNQAFKYKNCYALQFHPEVNFSVHLRWIYLVLLKNPKKLFVSGAQNIFTQFFLRFRYNKSISNWLDNFIDQYLLKER